jgi:hypothetical protein
MNPTVSVMMASVSLGKRRRELLIQGGKEAVLRKDPALGQGVQKVDLPAFV